MQLGVYELPGTPADALKFQCILCGQSIDRSSLDPCAIVLIANWQGPEDEQRVQQWFCHSRCFNERVSPAEIFEPDFE